MKLVVGLGNPGPRYADTRHNVGARVVERFGADHHLPCAETRFSGRFGIGRMGPLDVALLLPSTAMNRSGEAVQPVLDWIGWAGEEPSNLIVVYDDLDLPHAALRIRPHGGAGGQNGMRSIIDSLGTDRFPRLRVGIGRPRTDAARHVLERFAPQEEEDIAISVAEAADALFFWLRTGDIDQCMARFHSRWTQGSN